MNTLEAMDLMVAIVIVAVLIAVVVIVAVLIAVVIKWLSGDFDKKKKLKIGQRVAVITFNFDTNRDEFKTGKIVAIKSQMIGVEQSRPNAVRFDDEGIGLFSTEDIYTEWGEE